MGPLFVLAILSIVLFPIGVVVGFVFSFAAMPILHRVRKTPKQDRRAGLRGRLRISARLASVFVVTLLGVGLLDTYKDFNNYWRYKGAFDLFRMPLEEPYELVMIDSLDTASIGRWQESAHLMGGIIRCERRANFLIGETSRDTYADRNSPPTGWFIFDLTSGHMFRFRSRAGLYEAAPSHGVQPPFRLQSIKANWNHYWAHPRTTHK